MSNENDTPFVPDPRIQKFYEMAFGPDDTIAIGSHDLPNERGRRYMQEQQTSLSEMPDFQDESWRNNSDMFFAVLPMQPYEEQEGDNKRKRGQGIAQPGRMLWLDFDEGLNGSLRAEMEELGASIILSGSMNGLLPKAHAYIHLSQAEDPRELVWLSARLAAKYGADPSCAEAARLLRIPNTYNHKTTPPRPVTLDTLGDPCNIEDVYEYLDIERPDVDDLPELDDTHRATKDEVADFTRRTALLAGSTTGNIKGYITQYNERTTPGVISNRHLAMMAALNWAARESQAGQVCFSDAVDALRNVWRLSLGNDRARIESDEFDQMVEYAVGSLPSSPMDGEGQEISEFITDEMYAANKGLAHIRQSAHANMISPDILVYSVLGRMSSMIPPDVRLESTPDKSGTTNLCVACMGLAGAGKTSGGRAARTLLPAPQALKDEGYLSDLQLSTGEGIAESFYGFRYVDRLVEQKDGEGKVKSEPKTRKEKERAVVRSNVHFAMDEGEVLVKMASMPGSVVTEALRSAWTGGTLGQQNASQDKIRRVPGGTYSLGFVASFQPSVFGDVFDQASNGFPARFSYAAAGNLRGVVNEDGSIADIEDPGPLIEAFAVLTELWSEPENITYADEVRAEIRKEIFQQSQGSILDAAPKSKRHKEELELKSLDAHKTYHWAKLSALLVLLEGRTHVEPSDFALAKEMYEVQRIVRNLVLRVVRATRRVDDAAADARRKDVLSDASVDAGMKLAEMQSRATAQKLEPILTKVVAALESGKTALSVKKTKLSDAQKRLLPDALEYGVEKGVLQAINGKYILNNEETN